MAKRVSYGTRRFNGRKYYGVGPFRTKTAAKNYAAKKRKVGESARVVAEKGGVYAVYTD